MLASQSAHSNFKCVANHFSNSEWRLARVRVCRFVDLVTLWNQRLHLLSKFDHSLSFLPVIVLDGELADKDGLHDVRDNRVYHSADEDAEAIVRVTRLDRLARVAKRHTSCLICSASPCTEGDVVENKKHERARSRQPKERDRQNVRNDNGDEQWIVLVHWFAVRFAGAECECGSQELEVGDVEDHSLLVAYPLVVLDVVLSEVDRRHVEWAILDGYEVVGLERELDCRHKEHGEKNRNVKERLCWQVCRQILRWLCLCDENRHWKSAKQIDVEILAVRALHMNKVLNKSHVELNERIKLNELERLERGRQRSFALLDQRDAA